MFTNISQKDIPELYKLYRSNDYKQFFRHFEDFLNIDQFTQCLESFTWLLTEEGYISLKVHPKPKLCQVSILLLKEHQNKQIGVSTMLELGNYLFNNGIETIVVTVLEEDEHLNKICQKGGFTKEGTQINSCKIDNILKNETRYSISKQEYKERY